MRATGMRRAVAIAICSFSTIWSLLSNIASAQDTGPYVQKTGSTSTGNQTFNGKNGQVTLPPTYEPPFPLSGMVYDDTTLGLRRYTGSTWINLEHPTGLGSIVIQFGGTGNATATEINFSSGLTGSTSGVTATVTVDFGSGHSQAVRGDTSLAGDVTGGFSSTALSSSVNVSTTGTIKSSGGTSVIDQPQYGVVSTDGSSKLVASSDGGTSGQVWTSQGTTSVGHWANAAAQQGLFFANGYSNCRSNTLGVTTSEILVEAVQLADTSKNVTQLFNVDVTINYSTTGAGGCDSGTISTDQCWFTWVIIKKDGTGIKGLASNYRRWSAVNKPSGYSDGFARCCGCVFTKHTVANLVPSEERDFYLSFTNHWDDDVNSDGDDIVFNGNATVSTSVPWTKRVAPEVQDVLIQIQIDCTSSQSVSYIAGSIDGGTTENFLAYIRPTNTSVQPSVHWTTQWVHLNVSQGLNYRCNTSNTHCYLAVVGFRDIPGQCL
jgi:hypothetical protein